MSAPLEIIGRHTSYNVQKVLWLADELALKYDHVEAGGRHGGNDSSAFLAMNPHGRVPVLRDGNRVVWESNTILRYLADSYFTDIWIATDPYERSKTDRWLDWSIDRLERCFVQVFWGYYRTPEDRRDESEIAAGVEECERCLRVLGEQIAEQNFLLGDTPTLADVATGVFLYRLHVIEREVAFPDNIAAWFERLCKRPGYRRWVMSDFSELRGRTDY